MGHSVFMNSHNNHLLIVDDQKEIRESLKAYLVKHEYRITLAASAAEARKVLQTAAIDLIILDIMMPGEDGLSLTRDLRSRNLNNNGQIPIILLTAMAEETDRIIGLEMGSDDYLTKPFNPRELLARIKAVLRRSNTLPIPLAKQSAEDVILSFENWSLNTIRRELINPQGVSIPLSTGEFTMLSAFLNRPGMVLSRDQLLDITHGRDAIAFDRSVDNQISRLRKKIEIDPKNPQLIKTHWGGGYSFTAKVIKK